MGTYNQRQEVATSLEIKTDDVFTVTGQTENGGAISNAGAITTAESGVSNVKFTGNATNTSGGAIYNDGANAAVTLAGSAEGGIVFTANTATGTQESDGGGAIYNHSGTVTLSHVTFGGETTDESNTNIDANKAANGGAIYNCYGGTITLNNAIFSGNTTTGTGPNGGGGAIYNGGTITQTSGTVKFTNNSTSSLGGAIYNSSWGTITLNNATFSGNTAKNGGAIYNGGTITLNNATFSGNTATGTGPNDPSGSGGGGAIYNHSGTVTLSHVTFGGETTDESNTNIDANKAANGGAIYNTGALNLGDGVKFQHNEATDKGGAVYNSGTITQIGGTLEFDGNTATGRDPNDPNGNANGGAIYNAWYSTITLNNTTFTNNTVNGYTSDYGGIFYPGSGGAIYNDGTITLTNATFSGNTATGTGHYGGGGAIYNQGTITLTGTNVFNGNTAATSGGGAIYNWGTITLTDAMFENNTADYGGAIYNGSWGTITLTNTTFSGNTATGTGHYGGGAIYNQGTITLNNVTLQTATDTIYNSGTLSLTGQLIFGTDSGTGVMMTNQGELNLDIAGKTVEQIVSAPFISDWSRVDNTGGFLSVTASSAQEADEYLLASGIASFESDVFVIVKELYPARGYKVSAPDFIYGGKKYSLTKPPKGNRDLTLTISEDSSTNTTPLWEIVKNGETNEISGKVFRNLFARGSGGAIDNGGTITLTNTSFSGNTAKNGGAIDNGGTITLNNATFSGNTATGTGPNDPSGSGAIYNSSWGTITLNNATFTNNTVNGYTSDYDGIFYPGSGGAIDNGGTITLTDAAFSGNTAESGGAIYNIFGTITLTDATFSGNTAIQFGGAIYNGGNGSITLNNATFTNNSATRPIDHVLYFISHGGAISNWGTIMLTNATFSGNKAYKGGAIYNNGGTITLNNVTLKTAGDTIYNSTGGTIIVVGRLSFDPVTTTAMLTNAAADGSIPAGKLTFDLSAMNGHTPNGTALISDWARVDNQGTVCITVSGNQANGNYRLADNAANFNFNVTVNTNTTSPLELGTFTANTKSFDAGNKTYHLGINNTGNLFFSITEKGATPDLPGGMPITATSEKVAWNELPAGPEELYTLKLSTNNFANAITIRTKSTSFDLANMSDGEYQCRVRNETGNSTADGFITAKTGGAGSYSASGGDGIPDVFFAAKSGVWSNAFHARNNQTGETTSTAGKNRFQNVFAGSVSDANILYLTDDANGDALFQNDMYSRGSGAVRLDNIREIRAGAGGDVIDFTSNWLASGFSGTIIRGGDGDDTIWAGGKDAKLFGDAGNDILRGGKGNDLIAGGAGDDNLSGGGGNDIFAFGADWGNDTVAWNPDDGGSLTLVFEDGITLDTWDASATSLTSGGNTITFDGFTANDVTIQIGAEQIGGADEYAKLSACGAFLGNSAGKIYEDPGNPSGVIASL